MGRIDYGRCEHAGEATLVTVDVLLSVRVHGIVSVLELRLPTFYPRRSVARPDITGSTLNWQKVMSWNFGVNFGEFRFRMLPVHDSRLRFQNRKAQVTGAA